LEETAEDNDDMTSDHEEDVQGRDDEEEDVPVASASSYSESEY
jgi:hypothetical protein